MDRFAPSGGVVRRPGFSLSLLWYGQFATVVAAELGRLRERVSAACESHFNSVLVNLYRDGDDSMGWHADDEPELGPRPVIASLSLGATRRFRMQPRRGGRDVRRALSHAIDLTHGSLLVMAGDTQRDWRHAVPRTRSTVGPRINLTFRYVTAA